MPTPVRLCLAILLAAAPLSCGGSTSQDSTAGGGGGSTGGSPGGGSGGVGATAGSGGGGLGGAGGGTGATGGTSCTSYADETPPGYVTIRITNARPEPIYFGGGDICGPVLLYDLAGPKGPVTMTAGECGNTCELLQYNGDWCPDACFLPPTIVISPGGSYDTGWSGTTFQKETMPKSCYFEPELAPATCERRIIAPAGSYAAAATAGTAISCGSMQPCTCAPDAKGSCEIPFGASVVGPTLGAKVAFDMPGASMVVITFD